MVGVNPNIPSAVRSAFGWESDLVTFTPIVQGYINHTFLVHVAHQPQAILQCINTEVFEHVDQLMANIQLAQQVLHPTAQLIPTTNGDSYLNHPQHGTWRAAQYVDNSVCYSLAPNAVIAHAAGVLLGEFHTQLSSLAPSKFHVTLAGFQSMSLRLSQFDTAWTQASAQRKKEAESAVDGLKTIIARVAYLEDLPQNRVIHHDAKLSNMLFDRQNQKGLVVIDLDTLMPGSLFMDVGDCLRTLAVNTKEGDVNPASFLENHAQRFFQGYLTAMEGIITPEEIQSLHPGSVYMPSIHALRALTDYLLGDLYYQVQYPTQNLDRAKSLLGHAQCIAQGLSV